MMKNKNKEKKKGSKKKLIRNEKNLKFHFKVQVSQFNSIIYDLFFTFHQILTPKKYIGIEYMTTNKTAPY